MPLACCGGTSKWCVAAARRNCSFTTRPASTSGVSGATKAMLTITHTDALALAHVILVGEPVNSR